MYKVLFILKERSIYGSKVKSYGLMNSCEFVARKLNAIGVETKVVSVVDNNCIDREVHHYRPDLVIIEALWVVPDKFIELQNLHPTVQWAVRLHSNTPFLSSEGIAMEWLRAYQAFGVSVVANNECCVRDLTVAGVEAYYAPNIYEPGVPRHKSATNDEREIHIGCFGALRPLKNQLQQAVYSIEFAKRVGKELVFHINVSDHDDKQPESNAILRNLRALFYGTPHILCEHSWMNHIDFLQLVRTMDLGMQLSFSETFNIVSADFVHCDVPLVVSKQIDWICPMYKAEPTDFQDVMFVMNVAYKGKKFGLQRLNNMYLDYFNYAATRHWEMFLEKVSVRHSRRYYA